MEPTDATIEVLKGIREELRGTNARLDATNVRLDTTNVRLERVERRQADTEVRLATELAAVVGAVHEVRDLLREDRQLRDRVADHERRLTPGGTRFGG
jgi:chromosome segregation ATPase